MQTFISSSVFNDFKEAVNLAQELGVNLEVSRFATNLDDIDETFYDRVKQMKQDLKDFQGEVSLHAMFFDLCVVSADPLIREVSLKRAEQSLFAAKEFNAKTVVFHTGLNTTLKYAPYHLIFKKKYIAFWKEFVKEFEEAGMVAVIENLQETSPEFIFDVVKAVDSPNLRVSLDIGHVNIHSDVPVVEWIKYYNKYIYHMHIHNNYGDDDTHNSLLKGTINVQEVFDTIKKLKLNPKIILEIFEKGDVMESLIFYNKFLSPYKTSGTQTDILTPSTAL